MATTLTAGQIDAIRQTWIRDEWISDLSKGKSHYNIARKAEFFTDPDLQAITTYIENEYLEELEELERQKEAERLSAGDSSTDAETLAAASRVYALFRLIRAEAWEQMTNDPGFRKVFEEEPDTLKAMKDQVRADRNFIFRRSSFASLEVKRG